MEELVFREGMRKHLEGTDVDWGAPNRWDMEITDRRAAILTRGSD